MPTTHLSILGRDVQRVVTPLEDGDFDADRVRLVRAESDPEQGRDPDDCAPGTPQLHARVARTATEALSTALDAPIDEVRLPFDSSFPALYAATTNLLRELAADGTVDVNLSSASPHVAAAFYAARTALVDAGDVETDAITLFHVPATESLDLDVVSDLRAVVADVEMTRSALDGFERVADGPGAAAVVEPLRIALEDLRISLADASGDTSTARQLRSARPSPRRGQKGLNAVLGRAREQIADLVESDQQIPDPAETRDPDVVLDAIEAWVDSEVGLLSDVEEDPRELVTRFRESCEARFGKFEDEATVSLFESLGRFERHLDAYLDAREHLGAAYESVATRTAELDERVETSSDRLAALDESGVARGSGTYTLDRHTLAPLDDLEAVVLKILSTGPPRSRPRTRRAVASELRERAEHHGIVAAARDGGPKSSFEAFCVGVARNATEGESFEKRLSNDLRARLDVALEALTANGYVTTVEREAGRDAVEPTDAGRLWAETTDWETFRDEVVDDLLRDCVERELD
ncbi:hypothetical protein [Haloferax larsenii]|uniref:Uncharacterized protein n=1 Tax=Haloferax larsenii TaxID=302484 RepID=A0A1H7SK24_HALLR|nr:hypothetical protein [Haloferax larsenii]SEL72865.1 hypothetical protein SAMN04488691_107112 [Haloferax larsenii]